ncbi:myb-related protein MYBAS1-like isoform X2 [Macadamia integrifolia]|uniref:myb-related protein MYBAS1-like isoform X2 n=1 Tax=Macadamia integrifolia TaxID=60698 RepID=UPI001C501D31|nr:myb-related protein MYBAS1-like isoform X2 [Macadamia integrifolia]
MMVAPDETRKGPWTEQEDLQLMCFVGLFGDRRWDFIAKVSGSLVEGVMYYYYYYYYYSTSYYFEKKISLGLKRGRMTPQEERLVLELHSQWGNRWSRIARRLPGRTDNEIKNYWRTHMRKKAQERKRALSPPSSSSSTNSFSPTLDSTSGVSLPESQIMEGRSLHDKGVISTTGDLDVSGDRSEEEVAKGYSMDQIWKDIALMQEDVSSGPVYEGGLILCPQTPSMASPSCWNYCSDALWRMDDQEDLKMWLPTINDHFVSNYGHGLE